MVEFKNLGKNVQDNEDGGSDVNAKDDGIAQTDNTVATTSAGVNINNKKESKTSDKNVVKKSDKRNEKVTLNKLKNN